MLWPRPVTRIASSSAGPTARYRVRVGGSFQAKMSKPVTESALEIAWPGSGFPNTMVLRTAHGANTARLTAATIPTRRSRSMRGRSGRRHASQAQAAASQTASLRVRAAAPSSTPIASSRGSRRRAPRGSRSTRVISRHAPRATSPNRMVESGRADMSRRGR